MNIGQRIRFARERYREIGGKKLTQSALAKAVGIGQTAVSAWEVDGVEPRRGEMSMIAEALGVSVSWLEFGTEDDYPHGPHAAGDSKPAKPRPSRPADPENWRSSLTPVRLERFMRPLIEDVLDAKALKKLKTPVDYDRIAADCDVWIRESMALEPELPVTSHLAQYIVIVLSALAGEARLEVSPHDLRRPALQTARLLLESAPQSGRQAG